MEVDLEEWKEKAETAEKAAVSLNAQLAHMTAILNSQKTAVIENNSGAKMTILQGDCLQQSSSSLPPCPPSFVQLQTTRNSRSGSISMPPIAEDMVLAAAAAETRKSAAAEQFSQRISRDQRFKKTANVCEIHTSTNGNGGISATTGLSSSSTKQPTSSTIIRSPLKHINGNSPIHSSSKPNGQENDKKRALSPKGPLRSTSPARKHQAVEMKQPVLKHHVHTTAGGMKSDENHVPPVVTNKRPLRSTMRAL